MVYLYSLPWHAASRYRDTGAEDIYTIAAGQTPIMLTRIYWKDELWEELNSIRPFKMWNKDRKNNDIIIIIRVYVSAV